MKTLAEQMAEYVAGLRFEEMPAPVVHEVKRRVIDSIGCALGAWEAEPCVIARRVASRFSAKRGATLLGTTHLAPADWAAFANGCLVRYLDFNDTYLSKEPAHPSDNDFIVAIALAYEVQCRLCDTASLRARGWDHVTYGAFSTALAAARLMRLDVERTRHAVGIAGVASAALRQSRVGELSHWKGCAFANAARHGVFAALLAREGMTGPAPIFEGEKGFQALVSGPLDARVGDWGKDRDGKFMILNTSIKFWPAEYHSQSAIEAALKLRPQVGDTARIESVLVESHDAAVDIIGNELEKWRPTSRETADHSLPYIVAAALADGEVTAKQFGPARIADPPLLALLQRVKVERHAELSARYPKAVGNIVTVRLRDGRTLSERVDYPRGHAQNPLNDAEVEAKFLALADARLGRERADAVLRLLWRLDEARDWDQLMSLLKMSD
ncbi:MAG: MmgE/PrpD family protein [Verrucomicrobia bacterium]|nr:MAG: MmgE/PrpD family protein [Verrucomicrobiota bacterium]